MPEARKAVVRAYPPEATAKQYLASQESANSFSNKTVSAVSPATTL